jgi:hypothetical protein
LDIALAMTDEESPAAGVRCRFTQDAFFQSQIGQDGTNASAEKLPANTMLWIMSDFDNCNGNILTAPCRAEGQSGEACADNRYPFHRTIFREVQRGELFGSGESLPSLSCEERRGGVAVPSPLINTMDNSSVLLERQRASF